MKNKHFFFLSILTISLLSACNKRVSQLFINSPDASTSIHFDIVEGKAFYSVSRNGTAVIKPSKLGLNLKNSPGLDDNFKIGHYEISSFDQEWEQPWGEKHIIRNHYNELKVELVQNDTLNRRLNLVFRAFDDGIGFRYEIPSQSYLDSFVIMSEETEFSLAFNGEAWWIPAYKNNRYEYLYTKSKVSELGVVHTPLTIEAENGLFLSIHEAALVDYSSMTLAKTDSTKLTCDLVPWSNGDKVRTKTPLKTPWRTIEIADKPGNLITSYLTLNLNESNKIGDVSYIKPGKYLGIWWGLHIGEKTWASGEKHGATTENVLKYIDFAEKYGFCGVLVEGWNENWDGQLSGSKMNFTQPYPDFDINRITDYAKSKGIKLIGHNETFANVENYAQQMDSAYHFYKKHGVDIIKSGYVGSRLNHKEWHHGQFGVGFYHKALVKAAQNKIGIIAHEPIKDTGERRTYPNMLSREGARGQEYNAWDKNGGNPPCHTAILPFTRLLCSPMDFTPGVFDIMIKQRPGNRVNTTLAKQLALYVTIYSPFQMACDLPENYEANLPAFQFICDVVTDWEDTKVLNAEIGEYLTIVRKDRNSDEWFLGSITNEKEREFKIPLDFLAKDKEYIAQIYADGDEADWKTNPTAIKILEKRVNSNSILNIELAKGGGQAVRFMEVR